MLDLAFLDVPIVAAPMAGGPSTPELVAATAAAGGLGFLAGGYLTGEALTAQIARTRDLSYRPFGVNLFLVEEMDVDPGALADFRRRLEPRAAALGTRLDEPAHDDDHLAEKLDTVLREEPAVVSFTFGCPDRSVLDALADRGILAMVTVTNADEARLAVARGARSLTVQGPDAGGHRGTLDPAAEPGDQPLPELLDAVRDAVEVPLIAAGGLSTRDDIAAVLARGAVAAQLGTALLLSDEAGTPALHRAALRDPRFEGTVVTRAFTGRPARALANDLARQDAPAAYPQVNRMTRALRAAAMAAGDLSTAHLWAGTGYRRARPGPAADIVRSLDPSR